MAAPKDTQLAEKNQSSKTPINPADPSTGNLTSANGNPAEAGVPVTGENGQPAVQVQQPLNPGTNLVDDTSVTTTLNDETPVKPAEGKNVDAEKAKVGEKATVTYLLKGELHDFESGEIYEFNDPVEGVELTSFLIGQYNAGTVRLER